MKYSLVCNPKINKIENQDKLILIKLHAQIRFWKLYNISSIENNFFVNDDQEVDDKNAQMMCSIICYNNKVSAFNPRKKEEY